MLKTKQIATPFQHITETSVGKLLLKKVFGIMLVNYLTTYSVHFSMYRKTKVSVGVVPMVLAENRIPNTFCPQGIMS
jgi:hypothetical protein